jgi:Ca2+/Na+ antiporter
MWIFVSYLTLTRDGGVFNRYVVAIVAAVLAYKFEPEISIQRVGSDAGWYMMAIASVALMSSDQQLRLWECIFFIGLYCAYVVYSLVAERINAANVLSQKAPERAALLGGPADTNPGFLYSDEAAVAKQSTDSFAPTDTCIAAASAAESIWTESTHDGSWTDTARRIGNELLKIEDERWEDKPIIFRVITILQIPAHFVLIIANPVVIYDDRGKTWDRNRHLILSLCMLPFIVIVFDEDTFYADNEINTPTIAIAVALGVVIAIATRATSAVKDPPQYQGMFAGVGFMVALTCIYVISDEVVAVLTAVGNMLSIAPSLLGMTVLGIGNGTCDL